MDELILASDLPGRKICPWPAGKYKIHGMKTPVKKVPWFLEGDHYVELRWLKNGTEMNGYQVFFSVINI